MATPLPPSSFTPPLRITPRSECFAVEDATGRYVFSVHFDPRPARDDFVPGVTREKAREVAEITMRAFNEPPGREEREI